jgi:hypothetical protein
MFTTGLTVLFFLPPVGFVLYLLFGQNYARQRMFVIEERDYYGKSATMAMSAARYAAG